MERVRMRSSDGLGTRAGLESYTLGQAKTLDGVSSR